MKKNVLLLMGCFGVANYAHSITLVPVTQDAETTGVSFSYSLKNKASQPSNTFISSELVNLHLTFKIRKGDVGLVGDLFVVATKDGVRYQKLAGGGWALWDGNGSSLFSLSHKNLEREEVISVFDTDNLPAGEYVVRGGYKAEGKEDIFYNEIATPFLVFDKDSPSLHKVQNQSLLTNYFARGINPSTNKIFFSGSFSPPLVTSSFANLEVSTGSNAVSQTNLQEKGVDEADRIKTDGKQLYVLEACEINEQKQCITSYDIQASPASNQLLQKLETGSGIAYGGGLYLSTMSDKAHLIHFGDSLSSSVFDNWYTPFFWQNQETNVKFIDVSQPSNMKVSTHITIDSAILSSRLINGVLYLVARKNSYYPQPLFKADSPNLVEAPAKPEEQTVDDLLPTISFNDGELGVQVVNATDCYIPSQDSSKRVDNTIVTITAIPLDNPQAHYSSCIAGSVDTFYMSTKALYLATSRYSLASFGGELSFPETDVSTEIHKFLLADGALDYRGSGAVPGHLGWNADKQPFRMGEYNGILKVATSKGAVWNDTSTTRVSVMRESSDGNKLEEISFLDNLGKPGERLFAARFIQDRGYLVTFKQTDPLYVLDFTTPEKPSVVGELEINGYSDYLHPIGDHYLLGIGKDAIPNENLNLGGLYQGVKLSLFDVSNSENLREVSSIVLGERGTESAVLSDHHALAWLPSIEEGVSTLAIPVQLNTQQKTGDEAVYNNPSAYYGWTHTGLYTFTISTSAKPDIALQGKLISDTPPEQCNELGNYCTFLGQRTHNDRAVIQGDSIHYIHNNEVLSSAIADLK